MVHQSVLSETKPDGTRSDHAYAEGLEEQRTCRIAEED